MYNRYVPQPDGSYRKNSAPEPAPSPSRPPPPPPPPPAGQGVGSFLRQLLPRNFDTGDLIVVLLLLLMAADGPQEENTALLTLALYLFM